MRTTDMPPANLPVLPNQKHLLPIQTKDPTKSSKDVPTKFGEQTSSRLGSATIGQKPPAASALIGNEEKIDLINAQISILRTQAQMYLP